MEIDEHGHDYVDPNEEIFQYQNYGKDNDLTGIRNQLQLSEYIDQVVQNNNLSLDFTDSIVGENIIYNDDNVSEHSVDGQFDNYIDSIYNAQNDKVPEIPVSNTNDHDIINVVNNLKPTQIDEDLSHDQLTQNCSDLTIDEFGDFSPIVTESSSHVDYFFNKSAADIKHSDLSPDDFADFSFINEAVENFVPSQVTHSNSKIALPGQGNSVNTDIINPEKSPVDFADFSFVTETVDDVVPFPMENSEANNPADGDVHSINDFDDDFEDFATFEDCPVVVSNNVVTNPEICIENSGKSPVSIVVQTPGY